MAGDWIKLEHTTPDKPEVVQLATKLSIDQDAAVGKLIRIWIWADQNSLNGNALTVTDAFLDRVTSCPGFAGALREVGWLSGRQGLLTIPNFTRHNGQTAKARVVTNRRVSRHRDKSNGNADTVTNVTLRPLIKPLPEKRREEQIPPKPPNGGGDYLDHVDQAPTIRCQLPPALSSVPAFVACWERRWLPYLIERKGGRSPTIITLEKQLQTCARLGAYRAVSALDSAIEKEWAAPDENAKITNGPRPDRPWDTAPEDWKAWWRERYSPEEYPHAPRLENYEWKELSNDHRKTIFEGMQKRQRRSA